MNNQTNSDPLPFTQVDRAVKPKVALLAAAVGISPQHALGSLVEFWDLNGDPRELERLVAKGVTEVLLTPAEVGVRFRLASGVDVDPCLLASLGLLEHRGDVFRVRGMSRYFQPIERRVQAREAARLGGLARSANGLRINGKFAKTTETVAGALADERLSGRLSDPQPLPQAETSREPADTPAAGQPADQPLTMREPAQRSEVRGHRSSLKAAAAADELSGAGFFAWLQDRRLAAGLPAETPPHPNKLSAWYSQALLELNGDDGRLREAACRFSEDEYWQRQTPPLPYRAFLKNWRDYVPRRIAG